MQRDTAVAIVSRQSLDGAVGVHRPDVGVEYAGQNALCLAERVGVDEARLSVFLVVAPPRADVGEGLFLRAPSIDGKTEGGLGDEGVAADRLEGRARGVRLGLVVAGDDPDVAFVLEPNLGGSENMAGGNERYRDAVDVPDFVIVQELYGGVAAESGSQNACAFRGRHVMPAAPARMVAMRVRDDGAVHGEPRIDVEIGGLTVEAAVGDAEHGVHWIRVFDPVNARRTLSVAAFLLPYPATATIDPFLP